MDKLLNSRVLKEFFDPTGRERRIREYIDLSNQLVWQRQASFLAATILASIYIDPISTFACYLIVILTELLDQRLARNAKIWEISNPSVARRALNQMALNTILSSSAICAFIFNIALQQSSGGHFTPLFFLFAAALFAAMYNSQIPGILAIRLVFYGVTFLAIAFLDIYRFSPPLMSRIWLEFFTVIFLVGFVCDMSYKFYLGYEQRLAQLEAIKAEHDRTRAALAVKSEFLSTISHELRTPMTSIVGSLQLLNHGALGQVPDNLRPAIGLATRNCNRLASLIDDLLDLQRIESGKMNFQFQTINVKDLLKDAVDSFIGFASGAGIEVHTDLPRDECYILGDYARIIQVLNNLLSNAAKFSKKRGVVYVQAEVLKSNIRISVRDEGAGIPEGVRDLVFGRFSQVDSSDIRAIGGTGLGLSIAKEILERHGATIDYVSELGLGSTFFIEFERLMNEERCVSTPQKSSDSSVSSQKNLA